MALSRQNLLAAIPAKNAGLGRENIGVTGKGGVGQTKAGLAKLGPATRNVLGNIANKVQTVNEGQVKKSLPEKVIRRPSRVAIKSSDAHVSETGPFPIVKTCDDVPLTVVKEEILQEDVASTQITQQAVDGDVIVVSDSSDELEAVNMSSNMQVEDPINMSQHAGDVEAFSKQLMNVEDIDAEDTDNPNLVTEYVCDIYSYMRHLEERYPVRSKYLDSGSGQINYRMRGILVDWMVQVHQRFRLLPETLYLSIAVLDRFLQIQEVSRNKLQLVGVTAMYVASKYEEMYAPEITDFVHISDNAYTKLEIRNMEYTILKVLDFNLSYPIAIHFLRRYSKAANADAFKHSLGKYLLELSLVDYELMSCLPSKAAAAAIYLSLKIMDNSSSWTDTLAYYSKYSEAELKPVVGRLSNLLLSAATGKQTAVYNKYQSSKVMKVSLMEEVKSKYVRNLAAEATSKGSAH